MAIKLEQHRTQQTPFYKSQNREWKGRYRKSCREEITFSRLRIEHRYHPFISSQTRRTPMEGFHAPFSVKDWKKFFKKVNWKYFYSINIMKELLNL